MKNVVVLEFHALKLHENELDNCILLNNNKKVCEFINGNLFYVKENKIYTPNLQSSLVTRSLILILNYLFYK